MLTSLGILSRWVHITCVVFLLGGVLYVRLVARRDGGAFPRGWAFGTIFGLLASGLYNFLTKPAYPRGYHLWFGVKMLLVLHIFAVAVLLANPNAPAGKRMRWMSGVAVTGLIVLAISAWLRALWAR